MLNAFDQWVQSGTVVGVTAITSAVISALGIVVAVRLGSTKRQLSYGLAQNTPLLGGAPKHSMEDLKVLYREEPLTAPRVLYVRLVSRGRRAITRENFDGDNPLTFDLGARVVALLGAGTEPRSAAVPGVGKAGTKLEIWPGLILKRETITIAVLVDGEPGRIICNRRLADVDFRELSDEPEEDRWYHPRLIVAMVGLAILASLLRRNSGDLDEAFSLVAIAAGVVACVMSVWWATTAMAQTIRRRRPA